MSLTFIGPRGSFERRWVFYAMLRDNLQHHLENGTPGKAFEHVHALGSALFDGEAKVPAAALHAELGQISSLLGLPISQFAVSARTRAVQTLCFPLPDHRGTALASEENWAPPISVEGMTTLGDMFGSLVRELQSISENAGPDDLVRVLDG